MIYHVEIIDNWIPAMEKVSSCGERDSKVCRDHETWNQRSYLPVFLFPSPLCPETKR